MQKKLLPEAEQYAKQNNRRRIWRNFVRVMACIVVFCTTYALILPAITMEREPRCGLEEHIHTGKCYTQKTAEQVKKLACTYESLDVHVHDEQECYGEDKTLICGYADFLIHEHDASCVDEWGSLVCQLPEVKEHEHTQAECYRAVEMEPVSEVAEEVHENDDSSYTIASGELTCQIAEAKGHSHTQECYEAYLDENEVEQTKLICQETVVLEHTHSDSCYVVEEIPVDTETLTCGKEETEGHSHAEECYDENGELVCGLEEIEAHAHTDRCHGTWEMTCGYTVEHTHTLECYADKTADLETEETWTAGLPETTGTWRDDLLAVAESQLGYKESEKNYIVEADGETLSGYNRYGAWYASVSGDDSYAYAPWNVTFLFFDLYHAGIDVGDFPYEEDCAAWIDSLSASELYRGAGEYAPNPGDLIFVDTDGDGEADRAGLVSEVLEDTVTVIEGDYDGAVTQVTYTLPALTAAEETAETTEATEATEAAEVTEINLNASFTSIQLLSDEQDAETETTEAADKTETVEAAIVGYADMLQAQLATVQVEETAATVMVSGTAISDDIDGSISTTGGTYYLNGDAGADDSITLTSGTTTIDLNGYDLYYKGTGTFITVNSGAKLIIKNSGKPTLKKSAANGNKYGNTASVTKDESNGDNSSGVVTALTYYVTESTANGTSTTETLYKYEYTPDGTIIAQNTASAAGIIANHGTFELQGGLLSIWKPNYGSGYSHIVYNTGTFYMNGGYICGASDDGWGSGVYSSGTMNMTNGVIAANYSTCGGGVAVENGTFNMSGGVISGNGTHSGSATSGVWSSGYGGGVYGKKAAITISGGYITNNSEYGDCGNRGNGCHGGGGIATYGGSIQMTGGYVTGNYSQEAGGGIYAGNYNADVDATFTMSGGTVASNYAKTSEGGGIRISGRTTGAISAADGNTIYITNNTTNSDYDWGGGGIFVQENGTLNILNSLITNNDAGGFGGGVGACPTGETLIVHTEGAAIYSNDADGNNMSAGDHGKDYDAQVAKTNPVFMSSGYQDYFCVRESSSSDYVSLVTGEMVGGGAAGWSGSCDGKAITISKTGNAAAKYLFGLTANPDNDAIAEAIDAAGVIITGNTAYTHGGGIMTNGGLILGKKDEVTYAAPALDITATKVLKVEGETVNRDRDFTFQLKNGTGENAKVVGTAEADETTGEFTLSLSDKYTEAGTYTYYLSEVNDNRDGVTYDDAVYQIDVTIKVNSVTLLGVRFDTYYVDSVAVTKLGEAGSSGSESTTDDTFKIHYYNSDNWSNVYLYMWEESGDYLAGLTTSKKWPGVKIEKNADNSGWYTATFENVSGSGNFHFIINSGSEGGAGYADLQTDDLTGTYSGGGEIWVNSRTAAESTTSSPSGWVSGSDETTVTSNVSVSTTKNSDGSYSLTINGDAFTNEAKLPLKIKLTKKDATDSTKLLSGAKFKLVAAESLQVDQYDTTEADGLAEFTTIRRNTTYYLYEEEAPSGYMPAEAPWMVIVKDDTAELWSTKKENGASVKNQKIADFDVSEGTDLITLSTTITNQPWGYELPDTGGAGTYLYTLGGIVLMALPLLYGYNQWRKRERRAAR